MVEPTVRLALSRKAAAAALSVGLSFFDAIVRAGEIRPARLSGRKSVFAVSELERFLKKKTNQQNFPGKPLVG